MCIKDLCLSRPDVTVLPLDLITARGRWTMPYYNLLCFSLARILVKSDIRKIKEILYFCAS